ncbi:hypothetical protein [Bradyrhizobium lupini]|uniref:hypothetical protein n=1 Tax=Rhizobium lupini TaxID=136996 RepID=UPI0034C65D14
MLQGHGFSLQGTVVAVAADRAHHFSKPPQDWIMLVEGDGVEGDAHAGAFVKHRYLARRQSRSRRHGWALISTTRSCLAHARSTFSMSIS